MNSVHLIGRPATQVDMKEVDGGSKVSSFILEAFAPAGPGPPRSRR